MIKSRKGYAAIETVNFTSNEGESESESESESERTSDSDSENYDNEGAALSREDIRAP